LQLSRKSSKVQGTATPLQQMTTERNDRLERLRLSVREELRAALRDKILDEGERWTP
jgi:hypothetical protein